MTNNISDAGSADYVGFIYTSNNDPTGNGIIALGRESDGTLTELPGSPYPTGDLGDASAGDFDSQGAIRLVGDYLLVVNAGHNPSNGSISVFKVNRANGGLEQVNQNSDGGRTNNIDSRGTRPVSVAITTCGDTTWVVVGNQHSIVVYEGTSLVPKRDTIEASLLRNLAVFTFDLGTGVLAFHSVGPVYESGQYGGPNTVEFNADGTKLAASTEGVVHILHPDVDLSLQKPGRLYLYNFAGGALTQVGMFEEFGVSGNVGPAWSPNGNFVYMSNLNLHSSKEDSSITVHDGTTAAKLQNFGTGGRDDEACWTLLSLDQTKLYAASFANNRVSVFDVGDDSRLSVSLTPNFFARKHGTPVGDTKDLYEAPGYLYVLGALKSHSVAIFQTSSGGTLTEELCSPYRIPSSVDKTEMQHAFLGLTGFEK